MTPKTNNYFLINCSCSNVHNLFGNRGHENGSYLGVFGSAASNGSWSWDWVIFFQRWSVFGSNVSDLGASTVFEVMSRKIRFSCLSCPMWSALRILENVVCFKQKSYCLDSEEVVNNVTFVFCTSSSARHRGPPQIPGISCGRDVPGLVACRSAHDPQKRDQNGSIREPEL